MFGKRLPVRLAGVDTPEMRGKCALERAMAVKARDLVRGLLEKALRIDLLEPRRGKYFRLVARVLADGRDVARAIIAAGLGRPYDGGKRRGWCR